MDADQRTIDRAAAEHMLAAHRELRQHLAGIRAALAEGTGGPRSLSEQLRRHCLEYCHGLHAHHQGEESAFDTLLGARFPHLAAVVERLREEHRRIAEKLARLEVLLAADDATTPALRAELDRVVDGLEDHFAYEEEHLLPALGVPRPD